MFGGRAVVQVHFDLDSEYIGADKSIRRSKTLFTPEMRSEATSLSTLGLFASPAFTPSKGSFTFAWDALDFQSGFSFIAVTISPDTNRDCRCLRCNGPKIPFTRPAPRPKYWRVELRSFKHKLLETRIQKPLRAFSTHTDPVETYAGGTTRRQSDFCNRKNHLVGLRKF